MPRRLQISETELRQDIDVLNVVNFGGGSYVLYAEVQGDTIEVDPEPYGDNFARPARLLPLEAKALVAAIDLVGEHLPEGSLASAREKIVDALGRDPAIDGLQITTAKGDDSEIARVVSQRDRRPPAAGDRALQGGRGRVHLPHDRALPADQRQRGLVRARVRAGQGRHPLVPPRPHPLGRRARRDLRAARGRRARRAGLAHHRRGAHLRDGARVWVSPERARWAREDRRWSRSCRTAR